MENKDTTNIQQEKLLETIKEEAEKHLKTSSENDIKPVLLITFGIKGLREFQVQHIYDGILKLAEGMEDYHILARAILREETDYLDIKGVDIKDFTKKEFFDTFNDNGKIVKVHSIRGSEFLPKYATNGSAGMDIRASITNDEGEIKLKPFERAIIPTGLFVSIPTGYEIQIRARSGLSYKKGLTLANGVGTIDSDYRGELGCIMVNLSNEEVTVSDRDRIAQIVLSKYCEIKWEENTLNHIKNDKSERGSGGFGSTGKL